MITRNFFILLLVFASCGGDDSVTPPMEDPVIRTASSLDIRDVANAGNATDLEISFVKPTDRELIQEFRILIVKSENKTTFDSLASLSVVEGNYIVNAVNEPSARLSFDANIKDVDGDVVQEGVTYNFFVLSKATEESGLGGKLSAASADIQLMQKTAVKTITASIAAGSGGMDVDAEGNIYMADFGTTTGGPPGTKVYKITPQGEVSVFASGLLGASGNDFDNDGNLYQSNINNTANSVSKITPEGIVTTFATGLVNPVGIAFDGTSNFYVCNCGGNTISKVDMNGNVTQFSASGLFNCPNGIDIDEDGNLYVANFGSPIIVKITPDGTASSFATMPGNNMGHLLIRGDFIYVVARGNHSIYRLTFQGNVSLFAGTGVRGIDNGDLNQATFSLPNDMAFSPDGTKIYINDVNGSNPDATVIAPVVIRVIDIVN